MSLDKCPTCGTGIFTYNNINACLCSHIAEAEVATEERIIKLLEELKGPEIACCDDCRPYAERSANYLDAIIALIKGENK